MEDDNPKEIFWVLSVIGVVEKRRTRECTIYKHGPSRVRMRAIVIPKNPKGQVPGTSRLLRRSLGVRAV